MKTNRRWLSVLLAAVIALSLTPQGVFAEGSREFQPVPDGDWTQPYENTVNITTVISTDASREYKNGDSETNNPWTRAWKERFNIDVTYDWVDGTGGQSGTRLNLAIASGHLPDVFSVSYTQFRELVEADLLLDITDAYHNYASQRVLDYEKIDPYVMETVMVDGKIYGIPGYYYGIIDKPNYMWVRQDWYKEEGSPELKTVEDFENLARTFMAKHGGYGMGVSNTLEELFTSGPMFDVYLGNPYGGYDFWYKDEDGIIKAGISHPQMKTALTYWAKWFQEGIINPDFANVDTNRMHEEIVGGATGMHPWYQWEGWLDSTYLLMFQGLDSYMIPLNFPTIDGSPVKGQVGFPNSRITVVSKDCKNPAAVMKLLSFSDYILFDPDANLTEQEVRDYTDGQMEHTTGAFLIVEPQTDHLQYAHVSAAIKSGDTSELFTAGMKKKYEDSMSWIVNQDPAGIGAYLQQGFDGSAYANAQYLLDNGFIQKTDVWGPDPVDFESTLNAFDIIVQGVTKIIIGQEPVEYYDTVLADWYANGGQVMQDAVNRDYNK